MTRLRWLNSEVAQDDEVVAPFTAVQVIRAVAEEERGEERNAPEVPTAAFSVNLVNKNVTISTFGLPMDSHVSYITTRKGKPVTKIYPTLSSPVTIEVLHSGGQTVRLQAVKPAAVLSGGLTNRYES